MAPSVALITGKKYGPKLTRDLAGNRAVTNYCVSNSIPGVALGAVLAVVDLGDPYGSLLPGAIVQRIMPVQAGGGVTAATGGYNADQNGWCRVEVTYGPPEQTGITPDLTAWTQIHVSDQSVRLMYPVSPTTGEELTDEKPLNNGDGAIVLSGWVEAHIHTFHVGTVNPVLWSYVTQFLKRKPTNDAGIILPRVGGPSSTHTQTISAGQALYMGYEDKIVSPGVIGLTHRLGLAPNFRKQWRVRGSDGKSTASRDEIVYRQADFTGLWA